MSGLNKDEAKEKYSALVEAYEKDKLVDGFEPYFTFLKRVKKFVKLMPTLGCESAIFITHGKLLKALLNDIIVVRRYIYTL